MKIFDSQCEAVSKRQTIKQSNLATLYGVAFGNCSMIVQEKVMVTKGYVEHLKKKDFCWLIKVIQKLLNKIEDTRLPLLLRSEAMKSFYSQIQRPDQSLFDFSKELKAKMCLLDGMGYSHIIEIDEPYKEKLQEIFDKKGGNELLDGISTEEEKQKIILEFYRDYTLAI